MGILSILKIIAAIGTIITGLYSLIWPRAVYGFTGLSILGPRGITEIRAILGGVFIGVGLAPLLIRTPQTYQMLGFMYLTIAVVRAISMVVDRSVMQSNIISLVVEIVFGIILIM
jgi:hypothetical protein